MELLDIIDENNNLTGKILDRKTIHEKGIYHRQVACWIMNEKGEFLFQKRAETKKKNPNNWSRTGGHVDAGEEPIDGIQREIKEEIGVEIPKEKLILLQIDQRNKEFYRDEVLHCYYSYEYFTMVDYKIEDYILQKEEVSEVEYFSIEQMEEIKTRNDTQYRFTKWDNFYEVIEMLKKLRKGY